MVESKIKLEIWKDIAQLGLNEYDNLLSEGMDKRWLTEEELSFYTRHKFMYGSTRQNSLDMEEIIELCCPDFSEKGHILQVITETDLDQIDFREGNKNKINFESNFELFETKNTRYKQIKFSLEDQN